MHEKYNTAHEKDTICFQIQKWSKCPLPKAHRTRRRNLPIPQYRPFLKWGAQGEEAIALPFSKVEELTGKPLCKSAYKYASYWYPAQDRSLSNTIYNAGYDVDRVDLAAGIVYLTKAA